MKNFLKNIGYFFKETKTIIKLNWISNIFTLFSIGLIFFIVLSVISSWWLSNQIIEVIQKEAEINVYFDEGVKSIDEEIIEQVTSIEGVREARIIDKDEAYNRMTEVLGEEAQILEILDENPFSPFIEVQIHIDKVDTIVEQLNIMAGVDYVRDNKEVLDRITNIAGILKIMGYLFVIMVTISTVVIVSHIIRLGIYNNREQINTLALLGAPKLFISFPYLLGGLLLTVGGGVLAVGIMAVVIKYIYRQIAVSLPFIPVLPIETLIPSMAVLSILASGILGIIGSTLGLASIQGE